LLQIFRHAAANICNDRGSFLAWIDEKNALPRGRLIVILLLGNCVSIGGNKMLDTAKFFRKNPSLQMFVG